MDFTDDCNDELNNIMQVERFDIGFMQQGRKKKTSITGWNNSRDEDEMQAITATLKKKVCHCSGNLGKDDSGKYVITLFGDWREVVKSYLIDKQKVRPENIIVHGI